MTRVRFSGNAMRNDCSSIWELWQAKVKAGLLIGEAGFRRKFFEASKAMR